jgi:Tol biopolymer transport system component
VPAPSLATASRRLRGALALFLLLAAWLSSGTSGASSRDQHWRTIESDHFYVHFYQGSEAAAERAVMLLERAHRRLAAGLAHEPWLKTHVTLTDNTDSANGVANTSPFPRITAYVTAPDSMSVLEGFDDWIDILLTHEYTHVVHLDTVHGLPRLVNGLLGFGVAGKVWQPNVIQPRWFVEGLATYEESRLTSHGRHRHAQFDMMLRAPILEQGFIPIDRVSSGANIFPHGTSVYLYGLHLVQYVADRYGHDKLMELSHIYAKQTLPYGINRAVEKVLGVTWEKLWEEFELDTVRRFQAQAREIRARGVREGRRITFTVSGQASSNHVRHPFWAPDDEHIYYFEDDGQTNPGIRRIRSTGGRIREGVGVGRQGMTLDVERVVELQDAGSGSFVGVSSDMVFEIYGVHDLRYSWTDLYLWRPPAGGAVDVRQNPGDLEQLTFGARARDPHVSPDGRTVVFSRNDAAQARLAFLDLNTREVTEVAPAERLQVVTAPRWSFDGKKVAFSAWREGGMRDIYIYERETGKTIRATADRFLDSEPSWTPDGRWVLFSSDRDDVFNIYAYEVATGRVMQVTNVLGGAFEPVVSNDGSRLVYVGFARNGYDLWVMKLDPAAFFTPLPVIDARPQLDDPTPELAEDRGRPPLLRSRRYQAIRTMYPRTIMPGGLEAATSGGFGSALSASLGLADVLGFHSLSLSGSYLTAFDKPAGSVSYSFSRFLPALSISAGRSFARRTNYTRYIYDGLGDGTKAGPAYEQTDYDEKVTRVSAAIGVPVLRHPVHRADASLAYGYTHYAAIRGLSPVDPNAPTSDVPELGGQGQIDLRLSYSNLRNVRFGYGNQNGRAASVAVSVIDPRLGGRFSDLWVSAAYTEMIRMPWRGQQVLALTVSGAASAGGFGRRSPFYVGGDYQQSDVLRAFLQRTGYVDVGALHGYQPGAFNGRYYSVLNAEYRIPLADVERGIGTVPTFLRRVTMIPFVDVGGAWTTFTREVIKWSVGGSLVSSFKLGYGDSIDIFLQYARGFDDKYGLNYFRAAVARSF